MANLSNGNMIPAIYSKTAQLALEKKLCAAKIINRKIESPIKGFGDTVYIRKIDNLSMQSYTKNGTINWEDLPDEKVTVHIDQQKILPIKVDDIDAVQSDIAILKEYAAKSGYAVADDFDQYIFSLYANADSSNVIGTDISTGLDCGYASGEYSPVKIIAMAKRMLSKQNAFSDSPWFVAPPEFYEQMMDESGKAIEAQSMGSSQSIALNGFYKNFMGFNCFESNNVSSTAGVYGCMFGNVGAIAGAQQINKTETLRLESTMADGIRTLSVYGAKVVRPEALGVAYLKFDIEAA